MIKLDFDDVLIEPCFSSVYSRSEVDLDRLPIINANMRSVATDNLISAFSSAGGVTCSHRFQDPEKQILQFLEYSNPEYHWCTVGVSGSDLEIAMNFVDAGCEKICVDVAHAAQVQVANFCRELYSERKNIRLMIGNFGSPTSVVRFLTELGPAKNAVEYIKLGVGPGSACRTRQVTGVGYPQISLIQETRQLMFVERLEIPLVADGGVKNSGDVAKALAAGADLVMTGSLFKNCIEAERSYRGSASSVEYAHQNKFNRAPEGIDFLTVSSENVKSVAENLRMSLRSSFSYVGAFNLKGFQKQARLVAVSANTKMI